MLVLWRQRGFAIVIPGRSSLSLNEGDGMGRASSDQDLRQELLTLASKDLEVRQELSEKGELFGGYHPRMQVVHSRNAARLRAILDDHGWPCASTVGEDAAEAAWLVLQHAIGDPDLQRRGLGLLEAAVAAGRAPAWQAAMLEDRIRMFEGRPQRYGTQLWPNEHGAMRLYEIEDTAQVQARRREVGLEPLDERVARGPHVSGPPEDQVGEYEAWRRRVGWVP
jgi:hypothetical protein